MTLPARLGLVVLLIGGIPGCGDVANVGPDTGASSADGSADARSAADASSLDAAGPDAATCADVRAAIARWRGEADAVEETGAFPGVAHGGIGFGPGRHGTAFVLDGQDDLVGAGATDVL